MKTIAILVAVALVAMVTPTTSADEECDNHAYFENLLNTRPDGWEDARVEPREIVEKFAPAPVVDKDAIVNDLVAHVDGFCMEDIVNGAEDSGSFPAVSDFFLISELAYDFTGQHCNQGENVGVGGHYEIAADATTGAMPWSWGSAEYAGAAISDVSVSSTAYFTSAIFQDVTGGKAFSYAQEVTYVGVSDFYCVGYFDAFFGDYVTINLPYATGVIA